MPSTNRHSGRSAAVTGAGGGLGRDIALGLAARGYVVFGTAMSAAEVQDLKEASGGRVSLTVCDMTKEESVKAWAGGVSDALGDSGLDILINNAGILTPGPIEVLPLDAIRREFDVNVFGALSVINAFLPALRKARGRIVQVSTWTASVPLPFNGPSGASKAAMADPTIAARRLIELAEQVPAPSRAPVGTDAEEMLRAVREKSDAEQDVLRLQLVGLS